MVAVRQKVLAVKTEPSEAHSEPNSEPNREPFTPKSEPNEVDINSNDCASPCAEQQGWKSKVS